MDTLKGLVYLETTQGRETLCAAIEDPKNPKLTHVLRCEDRPVMLERNRKRSSFKFTAYRFRTLKVTEDIEVNLTNLIHDVPENCYIQIPISELKKLKQEWID